MLEKQIGVMAMLENTSLKCYTPVGRKQIKSRGRNLNMTIMGIGKPKWILTK